jgi:hypothetical protein
MMTVRRKPMAKSNLRQVLEEVRSLSRSEQAQLRMALEAMLAEPESGSTEENVERALFERGLLSEIKEPITDLSAYQDRRLVPILGKPLSETIIEERR